MAKLNYTHLVFAENKTGSGVVGLTYRFTVRSNFEGIPECRIYEDGGIVGPFALMTQSGGTYFLTGQLSASGKYHLEYKDDNGEKLLLTFTAQDADNVCFYNEGFQDFGSTISVTDSGVQIFTNPTLSSFFTSVNGGSLKSTGSSGASYSYSELSLLGAGTRIDSVAFQYVTALCTLVNYEDVYIGETADVPMEATYEETDCTAIGADDGTIIVSVTGGSGAQSFVWSDGPVTQNRTGLAPGLYTVTITDNTTAEVVVIEDIEILDPQAETLDEGSLLEIPSMNSIQFVVQPRGLCAEDSAAIYNDDLLEEPTDDETPDNTLLKDQVHIGFSKTFYDQKICIGDIRKVQFKSDFPSHSLQLFTKAHALVSSFIVTLVEENLGLSEDYLITIRNHTDNPGKSRVYFNVGDIPTELGLSIGSTFEILNNADGFNGSYSILAVEEDLSLGYEYLVITKNYDAATSSTGGTGRFVSSIEDFNTYESTVDFSGLTEGKYYLRIFAFGSTTGKVGVSEPIHIKATHPNTKLIRCKNVDNAFDITWTTGFECKIRVEANLTKRLPGGERSVSRNSDYSLNKISAKKKRGFLLEFYMLPPYMHEKLSTIVDCDLWYINEVQYQSEDAYGDPSYIDRFLLADSTVKIEQVGWYDRYNSNDLGTVADGGFLLTETGFLKL